MRSIMRIVWGMYLIGIGGWGCVYVNVPLDFGDRNRLYSVEGVGDAAIAIISIKGQISDKAISRSWPVGSGYSMVQSVKNALKDIKKNSKVKTLILEIDSPGGSVTASDMIYHAVLTFKKTTKIRVIAWISELGASGAYYIAGAADLIMASPTALVGSIGVIASNYNIKGLLDKVGVEARSIKSGKYKDFLSPVKEMTEEERLLMQAVVDSFHRRFVQIVAKSRPQLSQKKVEALANGEVYTADQAKELGLIDRVSYLDEVIDQVKGQLQLKDMQIIHYAFQTHTNQSVQALFEQVSRHEQHLWGQGDSYLNGMGLFLWRPLLLKF